MINNERCSGCSACENICPVNAIEIKINKLTGFKLAEINTTKCINCGKCDSVCPHISVKNKNNENEQEKYALQASEEIRKVSSSGGAFTVLANYYTQLGYKIVGVQWDKDWHAEYAIANNEDEWHKFRGSKYMQADVKDIFPKIKQLLDNNNKVLFTGVPCHVSGLLNFLGKKYDNLVTIDLFCGALSSPLIWDKWYEYQDIDKNNIVDINMRAKQQQGNKNHLIYIKENDGQIHNIFYDCSMAKNIVNKRKWSLPVCHECKYRDMNRVSDYTIADLWNSEKTCTELHDKTNSQVSTFLCNSDEAKKVVKILQNYENIIIKEIDSVKAPQNFDKKDTKSIFEKLHKNGIKKPKKDITEKPYDIAICGGTFNNNFGATLTYYALYRYLELQGYKTVLLPPSKKQFKGGMDPGNVFEKYCNIAPNYFKKNTIKFNKLANTFILGSDQMWNPNCALYKKLGMRCFLDYIKDDKTKIAYSTSFGGNDFPQDENYNRTQRLLKEFDAISCRESNGCDLLKEHCDIDAQHTIDPVFLLHIEEYDKLIDDSNVALPNGEYACYYANTPKSDELDFYHNLNKKLGLQEIIICNGQHPHAKNIKEKFPNENFVNPIFAQDWLKYIKNAKYVITSSFHCICFCIMYNIPFICTRSINDTRINWILNAVGLKNRCLHKKLEYENCMKLINTPLNNVKAKLMSFIHFSKEWLNNILPKSNVAKINVNNKIALCAIGKWEDQYLVEWIEHYKSLGFDNILFYDNNDEGDNNQYDTLKPYIDEGFVIYHDWRGKIGIETQINSYDDCIKTYNTKYKWIAFFDVDEFLELKNHTTIQEFLSNKKFNDFDCIGINWCNFTDNNIVYNDKSPLKDRFTKFVLSKQYKTIQNMSKIDLSKQIKSVHNLFITKNICNANGDMMNLSIIKPQYKSLEFIGDNAVLNHYKYKTIEEYITKIDRGYINYTKKYKKYVINNIDSIYNDPLCAAFTVMVNDFFECNNITIDKLLFLYNYMKQRNIINN